jgi:hypothetical protein
MAALFARKDCAEACGGIQFLAMVAARSVASIWHGGWLRARYSVTEYIVAIGL